MASKAEKLTEKELSLRDRFNDFVGFVLEKGKKSSLKINDKLIDDLSQTALKKREEVPTARGTQIAISISKKEQAYRALEDWVSANLKGEKFLVTSESVKAAVALYNILETADRPALSAKLEKWVVG
ncbi:MAG: hypothetical protein V1492_00640 [Candidatus Micrarchaeota archaeon]